MSFFEALFFIVLVSLLGYVFNVAPSFYIENKFNASNIASNLNIDVPEDETDCVHSRLEAMTNNSTCFNLYYYWGYTAEIMTHSLTLYVLFVVFFVASPLVIDGMNIPSRHLKYVILFTLVVWFVTWLVRSIAVTKGRAVGLNIPDLW